VRPLALIALVASVGCKQLPDVCDDFPGRTCIALQIDLASSGPATIDAVGLIPLQGLALSENAPVRRAPNGGDIPMPALLAIVPSSLEASAVAIEVDGLQNGALVGEAIFTGLIAAGDHVRASVSLARPGPDMAMPPPDLRMPDLAPPPCDPVAQSNCPSGHKCTVSGSGTVCVPNGTVATGAICTPSPDNCVPGDYCYSDGQNVRWCEHFCKIDSDCRGGGAGPLSSSNVAWCAFAVGSSRGCTTPCNPVPAAGASGCVSGSKCDAYNYTGSGGAGGSGGGSTSEVTDCEVIGAGGDGVTCTYDTDCLAGYGCFSHGGGASSCRPYCRMGNNADCTIAGETCHTVTNWVFIGACCPAAGC
jgi:hypothetical protein